MRLRCLQHQQNTQQNNKDWGRILKKIFLAGEGNNELGTRHYPKEPDGGHEPGVIEALLLKVNPEGWEIHKAIQWKHLHKYQVNRAQKDPQKTKGEEDSVKKLFLHAREAGCDLVVFARDNDSCDEDERTEPIARAINTEKARADSLLVVGALVRQKIEAWVLACKGVYRTEALKHPQDKLAELGVAEKHTKGMVAIVEATEIDKLPADAKNLREWIAAAKKALD